MPGVASRPGPDVGLLGNLFGKKMKDPVRGTAHVVSRTTLDGEAVWEHCRMQLVVEGPGVLATPAEWNGLVHNGKWPALGGTLPVTIDRADPTKVKVEWDDVEPNAVVARRHAERLAAEKRAGSPRLLSADDDSEADERIEQLERLARLHEQGILSDAELVEQKRQILES
jgi:hypothetical protein